MLTCKGRSPGKWTGLCFQQFSHLTRLYTADRMTRMPSATTPATFRIHRNQVRHLEELKPITGSAIVRALLKLYFEGRVPEAFTIALEETQRAEEDMKRNQYRERRKA